MTRVRRVMRLFKPMVHPNPCTAMLRTALMTGVLLLVVPAASAQIPETINWQAVLTDEGGPLDGPVHLVIRLYDVETGGTHLYEKDTTGVVAENGVVHVPLGPFQSVPFDGPLFAGVTAQGGAELEPRTPLFSVPFAMAVRGLRTTLHDNGFQRGMNVIGGQVQNTVAPNVLGATIAGGGFYDYDGYYRYNLVESSDGTISGGSDNRVRGYAGTVSGGNSNQANDESSTVGGGSRNLADGRSSTVGGGYFNEATGINATVGGGDTNHATGVDAAIAGGDHNQATGRASAVPGGSSNHARGGYSFAAGYGAQALHSGSFVWADSSQASPFTPILFSSTGDNQYLIRASGGVGIGVNDPKTQLDVADNLTVRTGGVNGEGGQLTLLDADALGGWEIDNFGTDGLEHLRFFRDKGYDDAPGVLVLANTGKVGIGRSDPIHALHVGTDGTNGNGAHVTAGGEWVNGSSRTFKEGFEPVDKKAVLERLAELEISRWRYKGGDEAAHIGPVAEDFYAAFGLGSDERYIGTVDADGVALAAIQALYRQNQELRAELEALRREVAGLKAGGR